MDSLGNTNAETDDQAGADKQDDELDDVPVLSGHASPASTAGVVPLSILQHLLLLKSIWPSVGGTLALALDGYKSSLTAPRFSLLLGQCLDIVLVHVDILFRFGLHEGVRRVGRFGLGLLADALGR